MAKLLDRSKHTTCPLTPIDVQLGLLPLMPTCKVRKPSHFEPSKRFTTIVSLVAVTSAFIAQITSPLLSFAQPGADVNVAATVLNDPQVEVAVFKTEFASALVRLRAAQSTLVLRSSAQLGPEKICPLESRKALQFVPSNTVATNVPVVPLRAPQTT